MRSLCETFAPDSAFCDEKAMLYQNENVNKCSIVKLKLPEIIIASEPINLAILLYNNSGIVETLA